MAVPAKILVVEDDDVAAEMLVQLLDMAGYGAELASTADQAVAALGSGRCNAALVDLTLPDVRTEDLVEKLRAVPNRPPLVVYSARMPEEIRGAAERLGAAAALQKPVAMDVLLAALARATGRHA